MAVTGKAGWHRTGAIVAFVFFALVALPIGLRTEVMFPAVAAIVALARCGKSFSSVKAGAVAVALLLLIPLVREVRTTGVSALPQALVSPRLDALVEMGESLRPVEQVVRWHAEGEPYQHGNSYWAPFERAGARAAAWRESDGGRERSAADERARARPDRRDRILAGGRSVPELRTGRRGVRARAVRHGAGPHRYDPRPPVGAVLAIATAYPPLLINIRNSFVSVPAQCAAGILVVFAAAAVRHMWSGRWCPEAMRVLLTSEARFERTAGRHDLGIGAERLHGVDPAPGRVLGGAHRSRASPTCASLRPGLFRHRVHGICFCALPPYSGFGVWCEAGSSVHAVVSRAVRACPAIIVRSPSPMAYLAARLALFGRPAIWRANRRRSGSGVFGRRLPASAAGPAATCGRGCTAASGA